jgi:hypothetical protein
MKELVQLFGVIVWIAGIVIAKGFWSTFFAIFVPFWAWYLVIEKVIVTYGLLG